VVTPHGRLDAAAVVVATGPWSRAVLGRCGVELPLKAGRVQVGLFNRVSEVESHGIFADTTLGIYVRPESDDFMLVGSLETKEANDFVDDPDVFRDTPDFDRITLYSERLTRRYPPMEEGSYFNGWASLYDVSPDWQPILDEIPGIAGLYCAVGSSGHGFKLAPAVGEMMATLILEGKEAEDDIEMFSIERLVTGRLADGKYANKILG
jgi:glycine/D-amino acid oxidase-like deaminating enzyme